MALVGLVVALTALTGAAVGSLAWREQRDRSRTLVDAAMAQAAGLVATHTARFLQDAESAARLGPELVARRQLDPDDGDALERFVVTVLGAHPQFTWVSYGDRTDRFVGAWRDAAGYTYVNRSFPRNGRIRLEEDRLLPDGRRQPIRRSDDHRYRPRERPYFRAAEARRDVVWTGPYQFYAGGGPGITCAAPLLDGALGVRGVFTVDFSLGRLEELLDAVEVSPRGRVLLATREGALVVGQRQRAQRLALAAGDADLVSAVTRHVASSAAPAFGLQHAGERYLARAVPLDAGGPGWTAQVVVPERDYTEQADAQARRGVLLGLLALAVAIVGGVATARWIARPLRELAELARRIRQGDLEVGVAPRSRDEIGVLARAMTDMVRALRDREFIRETLGRYVSPELAARCLRDRRALRLGGELREATVLMSDLRGFSEMSERLGPAATISVLNRYLAAMTRVILDHGGTIDDFIGDAILVVFGAPFRRDDDAARAVRCAWAMQQAMAGLNEENRRHALPDLAMGIAVHAGMVVAGNMGGPDRVKYGVLGPPVNVASRVQAIAAGGQVLLSEAVLARADGAIRVGAPRQVHAKGASEPVTVYVLDGLDARPIPSDPRSIGEPAGRPDEVSLTAV